MKPFNPAHDTSVILCPTASEEHPANSVLAQCDNCNQDIWINPVSDELRGRQEIPAMDANCAGEYITRDMKEENDDDHRR